MVKIYEAANIPLPERTLAYTIASLSYPWTHEADSVALDPYSPGPGADESSDESDVDYTSSEESGESESPWEEGVLKH